ncbi:MAG: aminoacyl-histidine dipeptidase [Bacteroidales bacterium]|nr:aminoacyl-histidine dipeptidase [Bacteroidales bacterium]
MEDILKLEPKTVWKYFHDITRIPHPSKKEKEIIEFMVRFGKENDLETIVDEIGNVIIRKPATKGMENRKGVILQSHLDMVPQKNSDKEHDFEKDPIDTIIDGDWVRADGTTLGADNGIGVAAAMSVLASKDLRHGPLEGLFTVDEETGMTGVFGLKKDLLKGDILLNLDSEDENELCVGCAGGMDISAAMEYGEEETPSGMVAYRIEARGLRGGHSGVDIALGRANSNKLMFRFLMQAETDFGIRLAEAGGGNLRNAIPRESYSVLLIKSGQTGDFEKFVRDYEKMYREEFIDTEPELVFSAEKCGIPARVINGKDQYRIIRAVFACPNGVQRMSQAVKDLVETSNNMAIVKCAGGNFEVHNLCRSSVDTSKEATAWRIAAVFQLINAKISMSGGYPGWKPNMNSSILLTMTDIYTSMFGEKPEVRAIHAGLECAIIGGTYPNLDMISFGPTIRHPHSPDEQVNIPSVKKFYDFLCKTLEEVPLK